MVKVNYEQTGTFGVYQSDKVIITFEGTMITNVEILVEGISMSHLRNELMSAVIVNKKALLDLEDYNSYDF